MRYFIILFLLFPVIVKAENLTRTFDISDLNQSQKNRIKAVVYNQVYRNTGIDSVPVVDRKTGKITFKDLTPQQVAILQSEVTKQKFLTHYNKIEQEQDAERMAEEQRIQNIKTSIKSKLPSSLTNEELKYLFGDRL